MGDNETAAFDPIFYFHHCFIDYTFAAWQQLWGLEKRGSLTVIKGYAGTILKEGQPPNFPVGTKIDMKTLLYPFENSRRELYTSDDMTDLKELGISYGPGSYSFLLDLVGKLKAKTPLDYIGVRPPVDLIGTKSPLDILF